MRNLIVKRAIEGFSDGPYHLLKARFNNIALTIDGTDRTVTEDVVFPINGLCPDLSSRLCALDRQDLERCFFTVEPIHDIDKDVPEDGDLVVQYHVMGPCICFTLAAVNGA